MKITKLEYMSEDKIWIRIEFEDGSIGLTSIGDNIRRRYTDIVDEYLKKGGVIEPMFTEAELAEQELVKCKDEALKYLRDTDFYFTIDKFEQLSAEEVDKLKAKRQECRDTINRVE